MTQLFTAYVTSKPKIWHELFCRNTVLHRFPLLAIIMEVLGCKKRRETRLHTTIIMEDSHLHGYPTADTQNRYTFANTQLLPRWLAVGKTEHIFLASTSVCKKDGMANWDSL